MTAWTFLIVPKRSPLQINFLQPSYLKGDAMRIIAIDASRRYGRVARSVEAAASAAESVGATVDRVRLCDLDIRTCTNCHLCYATGVCKIEDDLPHLAFRISEAQAIIFGIPARSIHANEATRAVLDRLSGYFSDAGQMHLPGLGQRDIPCTPAAKRVKRAVIITACRTPEPFASFFGHTVGPIKKLRAALDQSGIRTIGSLALTRGWQDQKRPDLEHGQASSLGRILAGKI